MKRIWLPETDLQVSRLSFGTARIHHLRSSKQRQKLLCEAYEQGFTHFDTSPYYGFGLAEAELGKFRASAGNQTTVATKIGMYSPTGRSGTSFQAYIKKGIGKVYPRLSKAEIDWSLVRAEKSLDESLRVLRRDVIDILFLHEPDQGVIHADEFWNWLVTQNQKGKIKYWGLAGIGTRVRDWIKNNHPIGQVLQAQDSLEAPKNWEGHLKRFPQITYGYLAANRIEVNAPGVRDAIKNAMLRNRFGSILVSTRQLKRIALLAESASEN